MQPTHVAALLLLIAAMAGCAAAPGDPASTEAPPALPAPTSAAWAPHETAPPAPAAAEPASFTAESLHDVLGRCDGGAGAAWGDVDGDGWPDLWSACGGGVLLRNRGGQLESWPSASGWSWPGSEAPLGPAEDDHARWPAAWADADRDGCLDLARARPGHGVHVAMGRCDGNGTAGPALDGAGPATDFAWLDADRDGTLDLAVAQGRLGLWLGRDEGFLAHALPQVQASTVWAADVDQDAFVDLLTAGPGGVRLLRNLGQSGFADVSSQSGLPSDPAAAALAGDLDGTGGTDLYVSGSDAGGMWTNRGGRIFVSPAERGEQAASAVAADLNGDGYADVVLARPGQVEVRWGGPAGLGAPVVAWQGSPGIVVVTALSDMDRDGDVDIIVATSGSAVLLRNGGAPGAWLQVLLAGSESPPQGLGAWVKVVEGQREWFRQVPGGGGGSGGHEAAAHFGLGDVDGVVDWVEVRWPSGMQQIITDARPGVTATVREQDACSGWDCVEDV